MTATTRLLYPIRGPPQGTVPPNCSTVTCMSSGARDPDPSLRNVVFDDLRRTRYQRYIQELRELYHFYLDGDTQARLARMGRIRRAFALLGWLLRSLLMKLSPQRRLLLLLAFLLAILGDTQLTLGNWMISADFGPSGFACLLVVLMLELKDKLVAKDEIAVARQVQLALLPRKQPRVPGWEVWSFSRPANDVGGDLVDYIELDALRHGVLLGDVAGKGLGAALLMAKLQATLRAIASEAGSLDELGARVNTIFHRDGLDNRYATLFYAELEHHSGHLRYLNAGHNPAFLLSRDGQRMLGASSQPLGMLAATKYIEGSLTLEPGDLLLAYSDGLTEARNVAGEEFGMERLERLLPSLKTQTPEAIGASILHEVDRFLGEARPGDDLSLLVIARSGGAAD